MNNTQRIMGYLGILQRITDYVKTKKEDYGLFRLDFRV